MNRQEGSNGQNMGHRPPAPPAICRGRPGCGNNAQCQLSEYKFCSCSVCSTVGVWVDNWFCRRACTQHLTPASHKLDSACHSHASTHAKPNSSTLDVNITVMRNRSLEHLLIEGQEVVRAALRKTEPSNACKLLARLCRLT